ncbi:MAG TPA: hypothetical protein GXZ52_04730 [Clostridiales bacterium]|jgi:hypothetical protein|nr:hypothetical protein [Clostridiales bacterium]
MAEKLEYKGDQEFKPYMSYEVRMAYQAGYAQWKEWPCEGETLHAGIGWFHPFGKSHYYAILGDCEEKKAFPIDKYFTEDWMEIYDTSLFCIYRLEDGDIYAYDGIFCVRAEGDEEVPYDSTFIRRDILCNVIVGGTGRYEGARGVMMGTAEGSGEVKKLSDNLSLPEGLLKCLTGYIKIPIKD